MRILSFRAIIRGISYEHEIRGYTDEPVRTSNHIVKVTVILLKEKGKTPPDSHFFAGSFFLLEKCKKKKKNLVNEGVIIIRLVHWYITSDSERVCWGSSQLPHVWGRREYSPHFVDEAEWLTFPWRRRKSPDFSPPDPHSHLPTWKNTHPTHNIPSLPPNKGTGKQSAREETLRAHPGFAGPESERSRNRGATKNTGEPNDGTQSPRQAGSQRIFITSYRDDRREGTQPHPLLLFSIC